MIAIATFLHDIHRIMPTEKGQFRSPKESLSQVANILESIALTPEQKEKILHCIEFHEEYDFSERGKTVQDLETLIVQDADNLDAI
ncbi:MAG: HD domain-containing protein [bacterium]